MAKKSMKVKQARQKKYQTREYKRCKLCEKRVKRWNGIDKVKSRR